MQTNVSNGAAAPREHEPSAAFVELTKKRVALLEPAGGEQSATPPASCPAPASEQPPPVKAAAFAFDVAPSWVVSAGRVVPPALGRTKPKTPDPKEHLTPMEADCLEGADAAWRDSIDIAGRAGWEYQANWRGAVARLVRAGYLERQERAKKLRVTDAGRARLADHREAEAAEEHNA